MESLLSYIIPIAFGAAISPTLLTVILVMLSNPKTPKPGIFGFLTGSLAVIIIVGVVGIAIAGGATSKIDDSTSSISSYIDLFFGFVLLILGIKRLIRRNGAKKPAVNLDKPLATSRYITLGIIMMATNFTTLVLYFEILKEIGVAHISLASAALILAIVVFIIMLPVTIPVTIYLLFPKTAQKILLPMNGFIQRHTNAIMVAVIFLFAALLIAKGLSAILG